MKIRTKQSGFSLTEVLMAVGILMVGLLLVAGTFPVGIHLTAVSTERTLGAVAADEAFAKVQIYGEQMDLSGLNLITSDTQKSIDYNEVFAGYSTPSQEINSNEFKYPSVNTPDSEQAYSWSAIFRFTNVNAPTQGQITVFVSRKVSNGLDYYNQNPTYEPTATPPSSRPIPVLLTDTNRSCDFNTNKIKLIGTDENYITNDTIIVIDETGEIYRIVDIDWTNKIALVDKKFPKTYTKFWVVPPPVSGGKSPCVGVYQRIINF